MPTHTHAKGDVEASFRTGLHLELTCFLGVLITSTDAANSLRTHFELIGQISFGCVLRHTRPRASRRV